MLRQGALGRFHSRHEMQLAASHLGGLGCGQAACPPRCTSAELSSQHSGHGKPLRALSISTSQGS